MIDFSTLRTKNFGELAEVCIDKAKAIGSCQGVENLSESGLSWDGIDQMMTDDPIWRIPSFNIVVTFSDRTGSKQYVKAIAEELIHKIN